MLVGWPHVGRLRPSAAAPAPAAAAAPPAQASVSCVPRLCFSAQRAPVLPGPTSSAEQREGRRNAAAATCVRRRCPFVCLKHSHNLKTLGRWRQRRPRQQQQHQQQRRRCRRRYCSDGAKMAAIPIGCRSAASFAHKQTPTYTQALTMCCTDLIAAGNNFHAHHSANLCQSARPASCWPS